MSVCGGDGSWKERSSIWISPFEARKKRLLAKSALQLGSDAALGIVPPLDLTIEVDEPWQQGELATPIQTSESNDSRLDNHDSIGMFHPVTSKTLKAQQGLVTESPLHRACCERSVTPSEVRELVSLYPWAVTSSAVLSCNKKVYCTARMMNVAKSVPEAYTLPLNLAISHGASSQVIELLIKSSSLVLLMKDGTMKESSLMILLKHRPQDLATLDKMLQVKPRCAYLLDKCRNTPLHIACMRGVPVQVVERLWQRAPESLRARNLQGNTPMDVAQVYTNACSDQICDFLRRKSVLEMLGSPKSRSLAARSSDMF